MIGIINAHMFGTEAEIGEHVNWSRPDVDTSEGWADTLGMSVEEYAASSPHMIVFEYVVDEWATSRNGRLRIRLHNTRENGRFEVYALDGHELAPMTRSFVAEREARAYANSIWGAQ